MITRRLTLLLALLVFPGIHLNAAPPPDPPPVPTLCVLPFFTPTDRDYGVVMSDRLTTGLYHRRDVPALESRRFELMEPDVLDDETMAGIVERLPDLEAGDGEALRKACPAGYVILGSEIVPQRVGNPGVTTVELYLLQLEPLEVLWSDRIKHDVRYIWVSKDWEGGESFVRDAVARLGFVDYDRQLPVFRRGEVPTRLALLPFYNIGNPILVKAAERFVHEELIADRVFEVVHKGEERKARAGAGVRLEAKKANAQAVMVGSMMDAGMTEDIEENVTTAARLVDVETGRIIWSGSASDRRVWRRQTPDAMARFVAEQLVKNFFDTIQRTEQRRMEKIRRKVGIRVIR